VQVELDKIDLLLSNDVFILRDKIETANKTFEAARFVTRSDCFMCDIAYLNYSLTAKGC
jgi:NurA-like 5'-3' nuclease